MSAKIANLTIRKPKKNCKNIGTWKKLAYKEIRQKNEENNEAKYKCVWLESSLFKVKGNFFFVKNTKKCGCLFSRSLEKI